MLPRLRRRRLNLRSPHPWHAVLLAVVPATAVAAVLSAGGCSDLIDAVPNPPDAGSGEAGMTIIGSDGAVDCVAEDAGFAPANDLVCTGLYSDFGSKALSAGVIPYDPGLPLWADGATVQRWVLLPAGQKIDTTNMNEWQFPLGTKFWQEFKVTGHRVETRFYWKRGNNDWVRGSYAWSGDESRATYSGGGEVGGSSYTIPSQDQCDQCHLGREDRILGFEAVSLVSAKASITGASLKDLVTSAPGALTVPDDGSGKGAPALAWLHSNCGTSCHSNSPGSAAGSTGLWLRLEVGSDGTLGAYKDTNTFKTAVNIPCTLQPYGGYGWKRITPHDAFSIDGGLEGSSLLPVMAEKRNDPLQMPPIATHVTDTADVAALKDWITNGNFQ